MNAQAKVARSSAFNVGEDFASLKSAVADEAAAKVEEWLSQQDPDYARPWNNGTIAAARSELATLIAQMIDEAVSIEDPDEAAANAFDEDADR